MTSLWQLGERDDWICWICHNRVDPHAPKGTPGAGSIDHVVPKSKGGGNEDRNLKLAHRRCNSQRGSRLPELHWPQDAQVIDPAPLWTAVKRRMRRPGEWEIVAMLPPGETSVVTWLEGALNLVSTEYEVRERPVSSIISVLEISLKK